ncbi:conjugal transfer protein [Erwinia sp. OLMDLW33]|nr:conjugal transfer protein [Erwinia sp. OLMDLW33]
MKPVLSGSITEAGSAVAMPEEKQIQAGNIGSFLSRFKLFSFSRIKNSLKNSPAAQRNLIYFALMLTVVVFPHFAGATDLLKTQKDDTTDTFGHGSTVEYMLYVAEIVVSVVAFIKSRNPMVFTGMIVVLLATRALFQLAGS